MLQLEQLNDEQRNAVMHGVGPLLVLAGPGSGKTFTITQRIFYLIETLKVPPEEILVITFTKEAALSMQRKFQKQSDKSYPVNFGTFHSVFYHILKQSKVSENRQILCESQKKKMIYPIVKKYHYRLRNYSQEAYEDLSEDVSLLLSAISLYKNIGSMEEAVKTLSLEWKTVFENVYKEYEHIRKQKQVMDFDDMVYECAQLLQKNIQIRQYWQRRFSHILMDEFQDINPMQYRVIGLLTKEPYHLFAVGDDDQAIYGFRGSQPACLKQFMRDYHAKQVFLSINYRSYAEIVKASMLVIEENKERFQKKLVAAENVIKTEAMKKVQKMQAVGGMEGMESVCICAFTERAEQYDHVTELLSAVNDGETYAVLFRTNSYMQAFAARLQRAGIPFAMKEKVNSIYENSIVKDIMAYLRLALGEKKRELWVQILNKPTRYISREVLAGGDELTIEDIKAYYHKSNCDSTSFLYKDKICSAIQVLEKQLGYLKRATPFLAVQYIRKVVGYEKYLKETCICKRNGKEKLEEAIELLEWLVEDSKNYTTIEEWQRAQEAYTKALQNKEMMIPKIISTEQISKNRTLQQQTNKVYLMTIHASKGLEFDHVLIPDCNEKIFPHGSMPDNRTCEEERRIFYVGMTRARKSLKLFCITGTAERPRLISRFLNPLWKHYSSSSTTSSNSH